MERSQKECNWEGNGIWSRYCAEIFARGPNSCGEEGCFMLVQKCRYFCSTCSPSVSWNVGRTFIPDYLFESLSSVPLILRILEELSLKRLFDYYESSCYPLTLLSEEGMIGGCDNKECVAKKNSATTGESIVTFLFFFFFTLPFFEGI